jgi:hypothetical protein
MSDSEDLNIIHRAFIAIKIKSRILQIHQSVSFGKNNNINKMRELFWKLILDSLELCFL